MNSSSSSQNLVEIDHNSQIPLFGLDFLGILDRGTNVLEVKPITICNLFCKYCFVSAGDYKTNFVATSDYLLDWITKAIALKQAEDIEIHIAPYGEFLLYPQLEHLIRNIRNMKAVKTISAQTNGLLLSKTKIQQLEEWGLDRLNISLNSMDADENADYCGVKSYNLPKLLENFDHVLHSKMDLLIAPVWFKGINDQGIQDVIAWILKKEAEGYSWPKLRLGIQNYLTYKTGRKIRKTRMREFSYFYSRLHKMEKETGLKLKLSPEDFDIVKTKAIIPPVKLNDIDKVQIVAKGRWKNEYIARYNEMWAVKVLSKGELALHQILTVKFVKSTLHGNLLSAIPSE